MAGGYEFLHPVEDVHSPDLLRSLGRAYTVMEYDAGFLSAREKKTLRRAGVALPAAWKNASDAMYREHVLKNGKRVGLLVFPPLPDGADIPDEATLEMIAASVRKARKRNDILVGVSDWGIIAEREYLTHASSDVPDILLGSGRGTGIRGQILAGGRTFFVRPYGQGKSINRIDVLKWPERKASFKWTPREGIHSSLIILNNRYYDNLKINQILSNVGESDKQGGAHNVQRSFHRPIDPLQGRRSR